MPRTLSEAEFNAAKDKALSAAPKGLSEAEFGRWWKIQGQSLMDGAVAEAENLPATPDGSAVGRFVSNAVETLNPLTAIKGVANAVMHPIGTATAVVGAQGEQFGKAAEDYRQGRYSEMVGHGAAGVLPLVGPAAAHTGEQMASGDVAGGLGRGAGLVTGVAAAGPLSRAAGRAVKAPAQAIGRRLYQSALKPTKSVLNGIRSATGPDGSRQILLDTALSEGIPVSARGAQKVETLIDSLNAEVSTRIKSAAARGATVDPQIVHQAIRDVAKDFSSQVNAQPELAAIDTVAENFAGNPNVAQQVAPGTPANFGQGRISGTPAQQGMAPIPVDVAQRMKQNTYKGLRGKYGREMGGTIEAEKAGARALKDGVSQAVPEVAALNARESTLIPLEEAIADAMRRRGNYGMFGLTPVVAAIPAVAHANFWPLLAAMTDRMPGLISRGGIWINRLGTASGRTATVAGKAAVGVNATSPSVDRTRTTAPVMP